MALFRYPATDEAFTKFFSPRVVDLANGSDRDSHPGRLVSPAPTFEFWLHHQGSTVNEESEEVG